MTWWCSSYSCDGGYYKCSSHFSSTLTITVTDLVTATDSGSAVSTVLQTFVTNGLDAHAIHIAYAHSDEIISTLSPTSSTATPTGTSTAIPTATATATTTPVPESAGGLSAGAKAGVGVGVAVGCAALIAGLVCFLIKRRRAADRPPAELDDQPKPQGRDEFQQYFAMENTVMEHPVTEYPMMEHYAVKDTRMQQPVMPQAAVYPSELSDEHSRRSPPTELDGGTATILHEMETPDRDSAGASPFRRPSSKRMYDWIRDT